MKLLYMYDKIGSQDAIPLIIVTSANINGTMYYTILHVITSAMI